MVTAVEYKINVIPHYTYVWYPHLSEKCVNDNNELSFIKKKVVTSTVVYISLLSTEKKTKSWQGVV